ncbi:MAG: serine hydrolase domain-containing protein [Duganella sp.]
MLSALWLAGSSAAMAQSAVPVAAAAAPAVAIAPAPAQQRTLDQHDVDGWLDGFLPYAINTGGIPGAVVVVVKDGQILTARGFGYADVAQRTPVDPARTLFRPGSVSKLVTWTAVMQMVEQKKLDLDADINQYLDFQVPPFEGKPVTLRQLMTHTAGFEEAAKGIINEAPAAAPKLGEMLKSWVPKRIFAPGTTPAYSNYGTGLAGYLVERVSGLPFDDYVERHVFAPLGMKMATFRQPLPAALAPHMAVGYGQPGKPARPFEVVAPQPAGALSVSGTDMGRFMIAHLQQGQGLLSPATAAMMHDSPLDKINPATLIGPLNRMELGFFETNINGRDVIAHLGDTESFHTALHLFRKEGVGIYVSFNGPGKAGATGVLRHALFQDFADRYLPGSGAADGTVDAKTAAEHALLMTGNWERSRRSDSSFFALGGLLSQIKVGLDEQGGLLIPALMARDGQPRKWVEIAPFVWRDHDGHDRLAAQVVDGKVVRWSMDMLSPFMVLERVPAGISASWLLPALGASLTVLVLTFLAWPAGWVLRRHYKVAPAVHDAASRRARRTQAVAGLSLAVLAGWTVLIVMMFTSLKYANTVSDPFLWVLQVVGIPVFAAAVRAGAYYAIGSWRERRWWRGRIWSVLVLLSTLVVLYTAVRFGLVAMTVSY